MKSSPGKTTAEKMMYFLLYAYFVSFMLLPFLPIIHFIATILILTYVFALMLLNWRRFDPQMLRDMWKY